MPPLLTASVADQAFAQLRRAIMTGELAAGERYSVERIADLLDLQVSRTPVREALVRLSEAGFVTVEPKRGFRVIKRNVHDIEELFQIRLMLEVPAAYRAAHKDAVVNIEKLSAEFNAMDEIAQSSPEEELEASPSDTPMPSSHELDLKFVDGDTRFHERILKGAGNKRLVLDVRKLRFSITALGAWRLSQSRRGGLRRVQHEHKTLLNAIEHHDQQAAAQAMYSHLVNTGNDLMLLLEKEGEGTFDRQWFDSVVVPSPLCHASRLSGVS